MSESEQARALKNSIIKQGYYAIKTHQDSYTERGVPDLLCCIKGVFVGIELKIAHGLSELRYTDHQKMHIENIRRAGGVGVGAVYDPMRSQGYRWALDEKVNGKTNHLTWISLAAVTESVLSLPIAIGVNLSERPRRVGQTPVLSPPSPS